MDAPIGIFDSGYGGLTVFKSIKERLPQYDYLYLGDNARTPYGTRSFETVYEYTLEAVKYLFDQGCHLVILACNTASAKALRTIQQNDLERIAPGKRVLGVIRPTTELLGKLSKTKNVGVFGTNGTVKSNSYLIELQKFYPELNVYQEACPMWVPLVENGELDNAGSEYFIKQHVDSIFSKCTEIDSLLLACTHYPMLASVIEKFLPAGVTLLSQGPIVAESLEDYLSRHPEIESKCSKNASERFLTSDSTDSFNTIGSLFLERPLNSQHIKIPH
jgi:glutamate racemase